MSQPIRRRVAILFFRSAPKNTNLVYRALRYCFLSSFVEFCSAVSEKSKMSQPIRGQSGHLAFPICPKKKTNLVGDVEALLAVKFY